LRAPATRDALAALAKAGRIDGEKAKVLSESYEYYRVIEHRLQMVNDQQTHSLPDDTEGLDRVARLHGLESGQMLLDRLAPRVEAVGNIYEVDHVNSILMAGRADLCVLARPHLLDPYWTLRAAAELGYRDAGVPVQYSSGFDQLERNLARQADMMVMKA